MSILENFFSNPNDKEIKGIQSIVDKTNELEEKISSFKDAAIQDRYQQISKEVRESIAQKLKGHKLDKESERKAILNVLDPYIPEVFALAREAAKRTIGQRHYDVQLIGAYVLHRGKIAEMRTGEGKTLVATLAASLNALTGRGVHIVTVNDYLARRDAGWMGQIYDFLGITVSTIIHDQALVFDKDYRVEQVLDERTEPLRPVTRKDAYLADITYGTNNEFGFDYLRDNMAQNLEQMVQRPLDFAIVDEVDSILIDEARTPLIISTAAEEASDKYYEFARLVKSLKPDKDYLTDEKANSATLTDEGIGVMEHQLGIENIYEEFGIENVHHIEQALKAHALFKKDKDYVIKDGEIIIVDEFTGRLMEGRRYSDGLHQAIEAKEGVEIKRESVTMATISFQNYFRLYTKLSGMTGTAATEAEEFNRIYKLDVTTIPTNKQMVRKDEPDLIYKDERAKFTAVAQDIKERYAKGQPVLIGTVSIEKNEILSDLLKREGIKHEVLNAKNHEKEAMIIEKAGQKGAVTVATNMAGRGTDIILGKDVPALGGLHVIGTERHESRRIDNQLRGRAGRQGDPGSSQFFVSLEDDLMRIFGSDRIKTIMETLKLPDDVPIQHGLITKSLEQAQKRVESQNFDIRKHLVEYDDVMNRQREYIYQKRRQIMKAENLRSEILDFYRDEAEIIVQSHFSVKTEELDHEKIVARATSIAPLTKDEVKQLSGESNDKKVVEVISQGFERAYTEKEKGLGENLTRILEQAVYLRTIDMLWVNHIDALTHLREGIGLRGYSQKDPLVEYKNEAYRMFQTLLGAIRDEVVNSFFKVTITNQNPESGVQDRKQEASEEKGTEGMENVKKPGNPKLNSGHKVGRNDPCPCGAVDPATGKPIKYKKCHGR
jgi:preprotein translocase subunit SecA